MFRFGRTPSLQVRFPAISTIGVMIFAAGAFLLVGVLETQQIESKLQQFSSNEMNSLYALVRTAMAKRREDPAGVAISVFNSWFDERNLRYPGEMWSVWGPKTKAYMAQTAAHQKPKDPRDAVDEEAMRTGRPVGRFVGNAYRYSLPIVMGVTEGTEDLSCQTCHTHQIGETNGDVIAVLSSSLDTVAEYKVLQRLLGAIALVAMVVAAALALTVWQIFGRTVSGPLVAMTRAMSALARGNTEVIIPAEDRADEIGEMARAVQVFKDNAIRVERLTAEQIRYQSALAAALAENDAILQNALVGVVLLRNRKIINCNRRLEEIFGYQQGEMIGLSSRIFYATEEIFADLGRRAYEIVGRGENFQEELLLRRRNGDVFWGELTGRAIDPKLPQGGSIWIYNDISERKRAEEELRVAATAMESQEGLVISNADGVILRVNRAFSEITGYSSEEAVGHKTNLLRSGRHDAAFYAAMWDSISRQGFWKGEIWNRRKDGQEYPEWLSITAVKGSSGETTHYVGTFADITQRKRLEEKLQELARTDPLTGLANRRTFVETIEAEHLRSKRFGSVTAILMIDIDHFKLVNDTHGHEAGDLALVALATTLKKQVRATDLPARFGGEEFVVLLVGTELSGALEMAERIRSAVAEIAVTLPSCSFGFTVSIGVSTFGDEEHWSAAIRRADQAMYRAKAAGRNRVVSIFSSADTPSASG